MINYKEIERDEFMKFFRDDEKLNELTPDDREEIFRTILLGSSDISKQLFDEIISDYSISNLKVINSEDDKE